MSRQLNLSLALPQEGGSVVMVEEWAGGGNLWRLIAASGGGRLSEQQLVQLVLEPLLRWARREGGL
jgi:hypothetical protein